MTTQQKIRAQVNVKGLLKNASSLFNGDFDDIAAELLQNSRRAGATRIDVTIEGDRITFKDNGRGIKDPSIILNIATSDWDKETLETEHPAGMGIFSLASREHVSVRSKDWQCDLTPEAFSGIKDVFVKSCTPIVGTSISFSLNNKDLELTYNKKPNWYKTLCSLVLYYPVNVFINGTLTKQVPFLQANNCSYVKEWCGLNIGVTRSGSVSTGLINFYGLVITDSYLPNLYSAKFGERYCVCIDLIQCPELKLVLPARKEPVIDEFHKQLEKECTLAVYEAAAQQPEGHFLKYDNYLEAKRLGVSINEARRKLWCYVPYCTTNTYVHQDLENVDNDTVILDYEKDDEFDEDEDYEYSGLCLFRESIERRNYMSVFVSSCLERAGIKDIRSPFSSISGYSWYRKLDIYRPLAIVAVEDEIETRITNVEELEDEELEDIEADELYIEFLKYKKDRSVPAEIVRFSIPYILLGNEYRYSDLASRDIKCFRNKHYDMPEYHEIEDMLECLYCDIDDEGDSADTQIDYFKQCARLWYLSKFVNEEEALKEQIISSCRNFAYALKFAGYNAEIKLTKTLVRYSSEMKIDVNLIKNEN